MPKGTMLDRLAGAMKTLGKREGKALTPRQRVAAAQRWNTLADLGEGEVERVERGADEMGLPSLKDMYRKYADKRLTELGLAKPSGFRADNPFRFDWMGEPYQYEARLKNYIPLTDAQYERILELEEEARQRALEEFPDDFDYMWRY